jgi:hypothetical protein
MSRLFTVAFVGFIGFTGVESAAQISAVTEAGEEVILYNDGTWKYLKDSVIAVEEIFTNTEKFVKPKSSTFLLKSNKLNIGVWLDPKKWSFKKATNNESAEFELQSKVGDLYGMIIAEGIEVPLEVLKTIAIDNGREVSPDLKIVKQEYRTVNGIKTLLLQMEGSMQGIKFTYYGYYFSSASGSLQFVTYTSQGLFNKYQSECDMLLNGLVELK